MGSHDESLDAEAEGSPQSTACDESGSHFDYGKAVPGLSPEPFYDVEVGAQRSSDESFPDIDDEFEVEGSVDPYNNVQVQETEIENASSPTSSSQGEKGLYLLVYWGLGNLGQGYIETASNLVPSKRSDYSCLLN